MNIVNHLYAKRGHKPQMVKPVDFMFDWTGDREGYAEQQTVEEMKGFLLSFARQQNRRVRRNDNRLNRPPKRLCNGNNRTTGSKTDG